MKGDAHTFIIAVSPLPTSGPSPRARCARRKCGGDDDATQLGGAARLLPGEAPAAGSAPSNTPALQILANLLQRRLAARKAGRLPLARATTRRRRMHRERERSRGTRVAGAACCRNLGKADAVLPDYFLKSRVPSARSAPSAAGSSCSSKQRRRAARRHGSARPQKGSHEQFDLLGRPQSSTVLVERTVPLREARCEQGSFGEVNAGSRTHRRWPQANSTEASHERRRPSRSTHETNLLFPSV